METLKEGTRLYINLTNRCNVNCPFCCMYSGTNKSREITFEQFKNIIDTCESDFELQLEGGEPLLHKGLFLFMEYAAYTGRCKKILVLTNGFELGSNVDSFVIFNKNHNIPVEFKVSINYYLVEQWKDYGTRKPPTGFISSMSMLEYALRFCRGLDIMFNVRKRAGEQDNWIDAELEKFHIKDKSNVFYLQSYGKLSGSDKYEKPVIVQNIEDWRVYASDGTCFGQDLIGRSEYEKLG